MLNYVLQSSKQKVFTARTGAFTIIMFLICWYYNAPLRQCAADMEYPCAIWVFPFLMSQYTFLIMFFFGVIYANADIPFMQYSNMYHLIRAGRRRWSVAQLSGLLFRSLALVLVTFFCSVVTLLPGIDITADWGKLLRSIGMGMVITNGELKYSFFYEIMIKLSPVQTICITGAITVLVVFLVSVSMFLVSLYVSRIAAISGATFYIFLIFFVLNMHPKIRNTLALFIPTVWPEVARMYTPDTGYYWLPPLSYMFVFLIVNIVIVVFWIFRRIGNVEFDWYCEDV